MDIGIPKEIKNHEYRVGMTPLGVRECVSAGHSVLVEKGAGIGAGFSDEDYRVAGAGLVGSAAEVFANSKMIVKVKEPQKVECEMLQDDQILFTFLHLAADLEQVKGLITSNCVAIAYETITSDDGSLPLLTPMSEVAGRIAVQAGAHALEKAHGGRGVLLSGVPGVAPGEVMVLGGGVVGTNAAMMALGLGANVTILDKSVARLRELEQEFSGRLNTIYSTSAAIEDQLAKADLVIGAVLVPGGAAPKLIQKKHLATMKPGAVLVDVAIDQGGCAETSKPTTHEKPTFEVDGVVHYCVANMPGAVSYTSTLALTNATLPYVLAIAERDYKYALRRDKHLQMGLNVCHGHVTHREVAEALNLSYVPARQFL